MITRWLPATNTLVVIERIYRYQFKSNYLKNHGLFAELFMDFRYLHEIYDFLEEKMNLIDQVFLMFLSPKYVVI